MISLPEGEQVVRSPVPVPDHLRYFGLIPTGRGKRLGAIGPVVDFREDPMSTVEAVKAVKSVKIVIDPDDVKSLKAAGFRL